MRFCVIKIVETHANKSSNNELSLQKMMNIRGIELYKQLEKTTFDGINFFLQKHFQMSE
jgi:hypothetical protein